MLHRQSSATIHREDPTLETLPYQHNNPLSVLQRLKRLAKNEDHDEVEIPVDSALPDQPNTVTIELTDQSSVAPVDVQTPVIETVPSMSTWNVHDDETTTVNATLVRQETTLSNQTDERTTASVLDGRLLYQTTEIDQHDANVTMSTAEWITTESNSSDEKNVTNPEISFLNLADVPQSNASQSLFVSTEEEERLLTTTPLLTSSEPPTEFDNRTDENGSHGWSFVALDDSATNNTSNESSTVSILQTDAPSIDQTLDEDTASNNLTVKMTDVSDTSLNEAVKDSNETGSLPSSSWKSISIPVCDQSCQCSMECPYGFEILNETCQCNPPCQVSDSNETYSIH